MTDSIHHFLSLEPDLGGVNIVLIAKECLPGKVKTRLHPPLSLEGAARVAAASIQDTLLALDTLPAKRRVLLFDGVTPPPGTDAYEVLPQVSGGLDERLAAMFDEMEGPTLLVGMDTPQLTAELLTVVCEEWPDDVDAWFGPANDGGFWALALSNPDGSLLRGVPMSQDDTGAEQLKRLYGAGLTVEFLATLVDVDTIDDAKKVATHIPHSEFAKTVREELLNDKDEQAA